ncbi:MAG: lipoyl protein ligase domain-containing protein [Elusimicrobiota bacterium]
MSSQEPSMIGPWSFSDSGFLSGLDNMRMDQELLDKNSNEQKVFPSLRFFGWNEPTVTYGYLMNAEKATTWALSQNVKNVVVRPTGGGVALHQPSDISLSLFWPKELGLLPETPRTCYAEIHRILKDGLEDYLSESKINLDPSLHSKKENSCETAPTEKLDRFSLCFQEPVCNDILINQEKIVGGALRITKKALLYQGTLQLQDNWNRATLSENLLNSFKRYFSLPESLEKTVKKEKTSDPFSFSLSN